MDTNPWPSSIRSLPWPRDGISYSYEHRGYIKPDKLELWLNRAFGPDKAKYVLIHGRIYVKAPRRPNSVRPSLHRWQSAYSIGPRERENAD